MRSWAFSQSSVRSGVHGLVSPFNAVSVYSVVSTHRVLGVRDLKRMGQTLGPLLKMYAHKVILLTLAWQPL